MFVGIALNMISTRKNISTGKVDMTIHEIRSIEAPGIICIKNLCADHGTENRCGCFVCRENMRKTGVSVIEMRHHRGWVLIHPDGRQEIIRT